MVVGVALIFRRAGAGKVLEPLLPIEVRTCPPAHGGVKRPPHRSRDRAVTRCGSTASSGFCNAAKAIMAALSVQ